MIRSPYRELEKKLGYRFRRRVRLETALTHPSYSHERDDLPEHNQRLEYLGDAALDLVCAHYLYDRHPEMQEGLLTKTRSMLVQTTTLARIGEQLGLGEFLKLGRGEINSGGKARPSNLADAVEGVIGAAYLDGGLKAVTRIFENLFVEVLEALAPEQTDNAKGELQEISQQRYKINPSYRIIHEEGPPHARAYLAEVCVEDRVLGTGRGSSKRMAEMDAARDALLKLKD